MYYILQAMYYVSEEGIFCGDPRLGVDGVGNIMVLIL
jgi:hypothetical protein